MWCHVMCNLTSTEWQQRESRDCISGEADNNQIGNNDSIASDFPKVAIDALQGHEAFCDVMVAWREELLLKG